LNFNLEQCPVCGSTRFEVIMSKSSGVTSDSKIVQARIDNSQCLGCGLVYNMSGARGTEDEFYAHEYSLLSDSDSAEFVYRSGGADGALRGVADLFLDWVSPRLASRGRVLEVGCGKGVFLRKFRERFPGWELSAIEPSSHARESARRNLPDLQLHDGNLETSPFLGGEFDLVVSIGVLEHVPDPVTFGKLLRDCTSGSGLCVLSVPNFANNPIDLTVADHLTRFTPSTFQRTLAAAGFRQLALDHRSRVPMWGIFCPDTPTRISTDVDRERHDAKVAARWIESALSSFGEIQVGKRTVGVYGTGVLAYAAMALGHLSADSIGCFFDDNPFLQGSTRAGQKVLPLEQWRATSVSNVCFSANPIYLPQMQRRVADVCGRDVTVWPLPDWPATT